MSGSIRVRFSGILLFVGNLVTLLTGLIFNVLIARNLQPAVLGTWFFIGSVIPYFQILEKAIPYWAGREIPRGRQVGRTTLLFNLLLSIPITIIFVLLSNSLSTAIEAEPRVFMLASLLIPTYYTSAALTSVTYSTAPHKLGLRTVIIDGVKIPLALALLPLGLEGVITAVIIGNIAYTTYLYKISQQHLRDSLNTGWLREKLKNIWLPLHESFLGYLSSATDALIVGLLLTTAELSNYGIALAIASVMGTAKGLTGAVYPKLLKTDTATEHELKALFKFQHIFTTPMTVGGIALAPRLVEIFGTRYLPAAPLLPLLLLSSAIGITSLTMKAIITGLEKNDINVASAKLLKTTLFTTQLPSYIYLAILVAMTTLTAGNLGIMGAALARLTASTLSMIPVCLLYSRRAKLGTVLYGLERTIPPSIIMALALILLNPRGTLPTLASIGLGAAVYFAVLLLIDRDARQLARKAVEEAKKLIVTQTE
ncbi:MAG: oligosaccharide flippase family protein [Candidatus Caldarchaeum sp.]